jgi:NAD(P)H-hydrate epimerase
MIGTGATGELKGKYKEAVLDINAFKEHFGAKVLAVDVPTGLDSDTGATETMEGLEPVVVHADRTATMAALKQGFFLQSAPDIVGEVAVVDLGAPLSSWSSYEEIKTFLIDEEDASTAFAPRKIATSKFDYGHALIISGSKGLTGAAVMSAMAALRMGCGLVSVATPESQRAIVAQSMPEIMTFGIHEDSHGLPTSDAFAQLEDLISKSTVVQYGSGILFTDETKELAIELLKNVDQTLVLDAGALIGLAKHHDLFKKRKAPTVITPHNGEMAQLLGVKREKVEQDRIGVARDFATKNNTIVVLKGAPTLFAFPDGSVFINATGNPGMATAGAGDVLCGMITGTIAQKPEDVLESVMFAVYAHGLAGDLARKEMTEQALIATDIVRFIPAAFKKLGLE